MRPTPCITLLTVVAAVSILGMVTLDADPPVRNDVPPWPIEQRRYFATLDELKRGWTDHRISTTVSEGELDNIKYRIMTASPYSGVNSVDVYCYINSTGASWRLYSVIFLPARETTNLGSFRVTVKHSSETAVELWHEGNAFMTLDLNKVARQGNDGSTTQTSDR
jgi:hypothetical protein